MATTFKKISNNAKSTVVDGDLNNTTDPVTFDVAGGDGSKFPSSGSFWVTVWDSTTYVDPGDDPNMEILLCTSRSTDSLTADRGEQGTSTVAHGGTPAVALLLTAQNMTDIHSAVNATEGAIVPTGAILDWTTDTAPSGWLLCDGSAVSRTTYADLFSVIGTTFGSGDGSTTFNLPNCEDKIAMGAGNSYSVGDTGGSSTINIAHDHDTDIQHDHGSHSHGDGTYRAEGVGGGSGWYYDEVASSSWTADHRVTGTYSSGSWSVSGRTDVVGSSSSTSVSLGSSSKTSDSALSSSQSILNPYIALTKIIKT